MVKRIVYILILILLNFVSTAQRLNIGLDLGIFTGVKTNTVFENEPHYLLVNSPYSVDQNSNINSTYLNQVYLARVWGVSSQLNNTFSFGANLNYESKNNINIKFGFNFYNAKDRVHYSFQNLVNNVDKDTLGYSINEDLNLSDDYISINRWINSYYLRLAYRIRVKTILKPHILLGITERIQLYSVYNSNIKDINPEELQNNSEIAMYKNNTYFQESLHRSTAFDGFNHYLNIGFGTRYHSLYLELLRHQTIGVNKSIYYIRNSFWEFKLSYNLISVPLFK